MHDTPFPAAVSRAFPLTALCRFPRLAQWQAEEAIALRLPPGRHLLPRTYRKDSGDDTVIDPETGRSNTGRPCLRSFRHAATINIIYIHLSAQCVCN